MILDARKFNYNELNTVMKEAVDTEIKVTNVSGQNQIGCGIEEKILYIEGKPGDGLGAYLNRGELFVIGNCQNGTGYKMNGGKIIIYGDCEDFTGCTMEDGEIYIKGNAGIGLGRNMSGYNTKNPVIVVGGIVGEGMGENQDGGTIIILGIGKNNEKLLGKCYAKGMLRGNIYIRADKKLENLPTGIRCEELLDIAEINKYIKSYSRYFNEEGYDEIYEELLGSRYFKLSRELGSLK